MLFSNSVKLTPTYTVKFPLTINLDFSIGENLGKSFTLIIYRKPPDTAGNYSFSKYPVDVTGEYGQPLDLDR